MHHTTWARLQSAVSVLCGLNSLQKRLEGACSELLPLKAEEFPQEISKDYENLMRRIDAVDDPEKNGKIYVFCEQLNDEDAEEIAEQILGWYDTVATKYCSA